MVPGAQQLPEAASDPCGADWSGICRSAAPPEPAKAVRNTGRFRVRERSNTALPCPPEGFEARSGLEGNLPEMSSAGTDGKLNLRRDGAWAAARTGRRCEAEAG